MMTHFKSLKLQQNRKMPTFDITVIPPLWPTRLASKSCHSVFIIPADRHISMVKQSYFSHLRRCVLKNILWLSSISIYSKYTILHVQNASLIRVFNHTADICTAIWHRSACIVVIVFTPTPTPQKSPLPYIHEQKKAFSMTILGQI